VTSLRVERDREAAEKRRGQLRIGVAVGVVVAAVAGLLALAGGRPIPPGRSAYDAGTTDPVAAAVPALSGFAEQARGLLFRTPPRIEVVDAATLARVRAEPLPAAEGAGEWTATTRALGLDARVPAAVPPAHYSYSRHTVYVRRGEVFDVHARVVLLRELTRALQDQSFDVLRLARAAAADGDRARALAALVEGDASRVQAAYVATLPPADRTALQVRREPSARSYGELERAFPTTVGHDFATALADHGGNAAVDGAFARPPVSTAQVIDPRDFLAGVEPVGVRPPPGEGRRVDAGTLGQFGLAALVTGGRRVLNVSSTSMWLGDSYGTFRTASGLCTYANVVLADTEAREQLARDLAGWLAARRGRAEVVRSAERGLRLRSCI
jgi:hypothetical protein